MFSLGEGVGGDQLDNVLVALKMRDVERAKLPLAAARLESSVREAAVGQEELNIVDVSLISGMHERAHAFMIPGFEVEGLRLDKGAKHGVVSLVSGPHGHAGPFAISRNAHGVRQKKIEAFVGFGNDRQVKSAFALGRLVHGVGVGKQEFHAFSLSMSSGDHERGSVEVPRGRAQIDSQFDDLGKLVDVADGGGVDGFFAGGFEKLRIHGSIISEPRRALGAGHGACWQCFGNAASIDHGGRIDFAGIEHVRGADAVEIVFKAIGELCAKKASVANGQGAGEDRPFKGGPCFEFAPSGLMGNVPSGLGGHEGVIVVGRGRIAPKPSCLMEPRSQRLVIDARSGNDFVQAGRGNPVMSPQG